MNLVFAKSGLFVRKSQKGFTLLELLVVITLLAVISVGALVAYEGIGENAQDVAAANSIKTADSAIRTYRSLEGVYPNQWDNLVNLDNGTTNQFIANQTEDFIAPLDLGALAAPIQNAVAVSLNSVGVNEFQSLLSTATFVAGSNPNEVWNESAPGVSVPADELEFEFDAAGALVPASIPAAANISVFASDTGAGCAIDGQNLNAAITAPVANSTRLNRINDVLGNDGCHLVVALGFGKDVPGTTLNSRAAISTAPTYVSNNINPSVNYARYIALFHVASSADDGNGDPLPTITAADIKPQAKLIAVVDTEGRAIDESIAGAYQE